MIHRHWISGAVLAGLGLVAGCGHSDCNDGFCGHRGFGGGLWDKLTGRSNMVTVSEGACCDSGPILEEPCCNGNAAVVRPPYAGPTFTAPNPQQLMPPAGQTNLPPLAPAPRIPAQAQPTPADPTSTTRIR